ncbi:hypothetical protein BDY21DRAFT_394816, partial [Lineolata rhizophorae]
AGTEKERRPGAAAIAVAAASRQRRRELSQVAGHQSCDAAILLQANKLRGHCARQGDGQGPEPGPARDKARLRLARRRELLRPSTSRTPRLALARRPADASPFSRSRRHSGPRRFPQSEPRRRAPTAAGPRIRFLPAIARPPPGQLFKLPPSLVDRRERRAESYVPRYGSPPTARCASLM